MVASLCEQPIELLPASFPDGTRCIIEGEPDSEGKLRVTSRCIVFPDGSRLHLSASATSDDRLWSIPHKYVVGWPEP
jgi:hypothetical protein